MPGFHLLNDANAMRSGADGTAFAVNKIVIAGDSITSTTPDQTVSATDFWSYQIKSAYPAKTWNVRAQASRTVGGSAWPGPPIEGEDTGSPTGNTLLLARDEILTTYRPDLVFVMIGANDLGAYSPANYLARLAAWAAPIRAAGIKIAYSPPTPYRNAANPHPNYTIYTSRRSELLSSLRDPAVWGQFADYYVPMGEHPDFNDAALIPQLYGDGVHPSSYLMPDGTGGQVRLFAAAKAFADTLFDTAHANATAPYAAVWPVDEGNLATSTLVTRRFILSGLAPAANHDLSVTGAEIRRNGGPWVTSLPDCYNGDVIDVRKTTSAASNQPVLYGLTIGSETRTITLTTVAQVDPVTYAHGGIVSESEAVQNKTFAGLTFGGGLAVLAITSKLGTTPAVTIGGTAATHVGKATMSAPWGYDVFVCPVSAGSHDVVVSRSATMSLTVMSYGTLTNADPAPVAFAAATSPGYQSEPFETPSLTVPANGLALGWFHEYGGASIIPATANSPSVLIAEGRATYQGETFGFALAKHGTTGPLSWNFAFGQYARAGVVFEAAGT